MRGRYFISGGGESARAGELWGNAGILRGEVSRVCVCTLCGQGVLCGGGAPGEREGGRWGENWPVSTMSTKLSRAYTFPGRGVACVFYKKNVFSTHFGIFYREFFVDIVDKWVNALIFV